MLKTILVVDDDPLLLQIHQTLLARLGYRAVVAADGIEALQAAQTHTPDLILLDVDLPGVNGFEVCRRIKTMPQLAGVPVVFCTGRDTPEDRKKASDAGGSAFLGKPFDVGTYSKCIRKQLDQAGHGPPER